MISFPNAKINLGLHVLSKREDGYHNLDSCFYPIGLCDALEIIPSSRFNFHPSGLPIPGTPDHNLITKAFQLLQNDFPEVGGAEVFLHKIIPMGAGLGGGSANGAFILKMLNDFYHLNLAQDQLISYAGKLGSDCPFFILNTPMLIGGTGDIMQPVDLDLSGKFIVLVNPGMHISTAEAFSGIAPHNDRPAITQLIQNPIKLWKDVLINDFETSAFKTYPELSAIKNNLYDQGALYASMTGTGSTIYGIFEQEKTIEMGNIIWQGTLS